MKIFFGAAIQGAHNREERAAVHRLIIDAAVFEVSPPSLGTGIEHAHAYLRPRLGLKAIPVIALYQKDYWPNNLSTMIRGITAEEAPHFRLKVYHEPADAGEFIPELLGDLVD